MTIEKIHTNRICTQNAPTDNRYNSDFGMGVEDLACAGSVTSREPREPTIDLQGPMSQSKGGWMMSLRGYADGHSTRTVLSVETRQKSTDSCQSVSSFCGFLPLLFFRSRSFAHSYSEIGEELVAYFMC